MVKTNKTNTTSPSMSPKPFIASKPVLGVRIGHNFQSLYPKKDCYKIANSDPDWPTASLPALSSPTITILGIWLQIV